MTVAVKTKGAVIEDFSSIINGCGMGFRNLTTQKEYGDFATDVFAHYPDQVVNLEFCQFSTTLKSAILERTVAAAISEMPGTVANVKGSLADLSKEQFDNMVKFFPDIPTTDDFLIRIKARFEAGLAGCQNVPTTVANAINLAEPSLK